MEFELFNEKPSETKTPQPEESLGGTLLRNITRLGARALEASAGSVGNLESLGRTALNFAGNKIAGQDIVPSQSIFPNSQNIRELLGESNYLKPQGEPDSWQKFIESGADELIGDIAALATPTPLLIGGGLLSKGTHLAKAAKIAGAGNLAGFLTKKVTGSETAGDIAKVGTMFATSLTGVPKVKEFEKNAYSKAWSNVPEGAKVSIDKVRPAIKKLSGLVDSSVKTPEVESVVKYLKAIDDNTHNGQMSLRAADRIRKQINNFSFSGNKDLKDIEKLLPTLSGGLKEAIGDYGRTNKAFYIPYLQGNEVHAGLNASSQVTQFLKDVVNIDKFKNPLSLALFGLSSKYGPGLLPTAAAVGTAFGTRELFKAGELLYRSPIIRNQWYSVINSALQRNASATAKNLARLEGSLEKESAAEGEDTFELFN